MLFHQCKIWQLAMTITKAPIFHTHTPLWDNPHLRELLTVPGHKLWIAQGVRFLSQVVANVSVKKVPGIKR